MAPKPGPGALSARPSGDGFTVHRGDPDHQGGRAAQAALGDGVLFDAATGYPEAVYPN